MNNNFTEFVNLTLLRWTALQLAIDQQFNKNQLEILTNLILDFFTSFKTVEPFELENNFIDYFDYYFNISVQDSSCLQVSNVLCDGYKKLLNGDLSDLNRLRSLELKVDQVLSKCILNNKEDDDDNENIEDSMNNMHIIKEKQVPIIDNDGFELVQRKGRK